MTENDIKAELSYAYLHAVASRAGFACEVTGRLSDGAGVDAVLRCLARLASDSVFTSFLAEVQLKATPDVAPVADGSMPFWLRLDHYDKLRRTDTPLPRLLVVLYFPTDPALWLAHTTQELIARRCAYWVSLRGAPASENKSGQTVYLPGVNAFSPGALRELMTRISRGEELLHGPSSAS